MTGRKQHNQWQRGLKLLKAIALERVAEEINARRFDQLQQRVAESAAGSAAQRKRMRRLVQLFESGKLDELPSDMKAHPSRMKQTLIALHMAIGERPCVTRSVAGIAAKHEGLKESTARRGILDLDEACLIAVKRKERARRAGGQGPSEYMIVWSTIRDLAITQGLQLELFDAAASSESDQAPGGTEGAADSVGAESHRPDESSGQNRPPASDVCERAPSHRGRAPAHRGRAASHGGRACSTAPGNLPSGSEPTLETSSSKLPSFCLVTKAKPKRPKKKLEFVLLWEEAARRLHAYGLGSARVVANPTQGRGSAGENGWSAEQVLQFLDDIERESIDGEPKYEPGAVWFQLTKCPPGSRINGMRPREAWQRAQRDRTVKAAAERKAKQDAAEAAERAARADADDEPTPFEQRLARHLARQQKSNAAQEATLPIEADGSEGTTPGPHEE